MADAATDRITLANGAEMPRLGLGTWHLTGPEGVESVEHALEIGYRLLDTSGDYGNHSEIGEAIRSAGVGRDEIFIVSKVEPDEDAYASMRENCAELGVEHLDLCLIHHPPSSGAGEELWEGLIEAQRDGLAREIGVSNYSSEQVDALAEASGERPAVNQIEWTPFGHSEDVLDHARRTGTVIQAYSPLTRGERLDDETLVEIAERHGKTPAQVTLRWHLQYGSAPIPKASSADHRAENLDVYDFELDEGDMERLSSLNEHYAAVTSLPYV